MDKKFKEALDLLSKINNELSNKLTNEELDLIDRAITRYTYYSQKLHTIVNKSLHKDLIADTDAISILHSLNRILKILEESLGIVQNLLIKIMDKNNYGKNS